MFRVYMISKDGKEEVLGGKRYVLTFPTPQKAIANARALIGTCDKLEVRDVSDPKEPLVVWELADARSAPIQEKA